MEQSFSTFFHWLALRLLCNRPRVLQFQSLEFKEDFVCVFESRLTTALLTRGQTEYEWKIRVENPEQDKTKKKEEGIKSEEQINLEMVFLLLSHSDKQTLRAAGLARVSARLLSFRNPPQAKAGERNIVGSLIQLVNALVSGEEEEERE